MVKIYFLSIFGLFLIVGTTASFAKYLRADFMGLKEAEQKWGAKPFDATIFKASDMKARAPMAVGLIKSKKYIGQSYDVVKKELGEHDGYYVNDFIPAYIIDEKTKEPREAWQIVFLPDKSQENVLEVMIHKNCCYNK